MELATRRSPQNLGYEFANTGFIPYQPVKRQLVRMIKDVNKARKLGGCSDQIPYRVVLGLKRNQVSPFAKDETSNLESAA